MWWPSARRCGGRLPQILPAWRSREARQKIDPAAPAGWRALALARLGQQPQARAAWQDDVPASIAAGLRCPPRRLASVEAIQCRRPGLPAIDTGRESRESVGLE